MWVGLTGGIASGKSSVCSVLEAEDIPVIYADRLAQQALRPGSPLVEPVVDHFGAGILDPDGSIDRGRLGAIVFNQPKEREWLENQIHPYVRQKVNEQKRQWREQGHEVGVYEVPLLFEKKMQSLFDKIVVVVADEAQQQQRLVEDRGLSPDEAKSRIHSQIANSIKEKQGDHVIRNNGGIEALNSQARDFVTLLWNWVESAATQGGVH